MEVIRKTLLDVIAWDTNARFRIPRWQRHYVWGEKEVGQMWADWNNDCARDVKHFCGVMLFRQIPGDVASTWEIVDGQQRMTTFFLFFVALRDICGLKDIDFEELSGVFTLPGSQECRLVLQEGLNEDREIMNALLAHNVERVEKKLRDESVLYRAYSFFNTQLGNMAPAEIPGFVLKILQNLNLVVLTVDETDDTRRIFEALNSRGKQVNADQLVANLIKFISSDDEELNRRAQSDWDSITDLFDQDDLGDFLQAFSVRNGQHSERGTVFDEIKFELDQAQKENRVREWLREFKRAAHNYNDILFPDQSDDDPTKNLLRELRRLRISKLNPFLLALLEAFRDTPANPPLMHNIVSAVVRLLIVRDRPASRLEKFAEDAGAVFDQSSLSRDEQLKRIIALIDALWIDDGTFRAAFAMKSIYGMGAHLARLRYYLEKLEQKISQAAGMPFDLHFGSQTTVEHIMPQTPDQGGAWKSALRTNDPVRFESQYRSLVHTIGNLTVLLTKDNPAAGNASYAEKREFYLHPDEALKKRGIRRKFSIGTCALNRYFENVPSWNFQTIATRGQYLAGLAAEIWNKEDWNFETK
jgi:hypothetical protein